MAFGGNSCSEIVIQPFLKWAGGKRWLCGDHADLFPERYNRYVEPFLGSGAVFFSLVPDAALISDLNVDLIDAYRAIKLDWSKVYDALKFHQAMHSKAYYYSVRAKTRGSIFENAARFIYLNRTCWNGLYRVNLSGIFNVPKGTKSNVLIDTDDFASVSEVLQRAELLTGDFEQVIDQTGKGDFVFVDPPYTVRHNLNGFVKYNESLFQWEDQIRLRDCIERAIQRGALVLMTNANHRSVRDLFRRLPGTYISLSRNSVISGSAEHRGRTSELIYRSW